MNPALVIEVDQPS